MERNGSLLPARSSLLGAIGGALRAAGDDRPLCDLAGASGLAFATRVGANLGPEGPTAFAWAADLPEALRLLGYDARVFASAPDDPVAAHVRAEARDALERALGAGRPAVAWGIHVAAFGLVNSFDGARGTIAVSGLLDDQGGRTEIPWDDLGRGEAPMFFLLLPGPRLPVDATAALDASLARALDELSGRTSVRAPARSGEDAWDLALDGLRRGRVDPAGCAYTIAHLAEARSLAAEWLRALPGEGLARAADAAWEASGNLLAASRLLPFPLPPGTEIDATVLAAVVESLGRARAADATLRQALGDALRIRRQAEAASIVVDEIRPDEAHRLFACLADVPLGGLETSEASCRESLRPRLGRDFFALVARGAGGRIDGHVYAAPLERSFYPIQADRPVLLLFCAWVRSDRRGRGLGPRLVEALRARAAALGMAGVVAESTELDVFLPEGAWRKLGFRELEREGPMRLGFLPANAQEGDLRARWIPPAAGAGLTVRHAPNCPLLDASRRAAAAAARAAGTAVDEADATGAEAGVAAMGRRLPNLPLPGEAVLGLVTLGSRARP